MALNDMQVTFSPHGSFSLFITQSLTCDQSRLYSPAPSHLSSIWSSQQPREENQDPKRTWPAQGLTAQAVHSSAFPLIPNIPALEHFPLVQKSQWSESPIHEGTGSYVCTREYPRVPPSHLDRPCPICQTPVSLQWVTHAIWPSTHLSCHYKPYSTLP